MSAGREMTLNEWVAQLPPTHGAKSELDALRRKAVEASSLLGEIRNDYQAGLGISAENYAAFCRMGAHGRMPNDTWATHFHARLAQIDALVAALGAR